jgi:hypothetical protein
MTPNPTKPLAKARQHSFGMSARTLHTLLMKFLPFKDTTTACEGSGSLGSVPRTKGNAAKS